MLVILFLFDKKRGTVWIKEHKDSYEYVSGDSTRTETAAETARRLAYDSIRLNLNDNILKFVRRESYTVKSKGVCYVNNVVTFAYDCVDADLSDLGYSSIDYDTVMKTLCSRGRYFQAAYLEEAYKAL